MAANFGFVLCTAEDGPELIVSSVSGDLETGRPNDFMISLYNNANATSLEEIELGAERSKALGIMAQLMSQDERIKVLSDTQPAGSLAAGENRSILFAVQPGKEAELGVYPLELFLSYSNLTDVSISEDQSILFIYMNNSKTIPVEARVSLGPQISIEDVKGAVIPGQESNIEIIISNNGDKIARDLQLFIEPQNPFQNLTINSKLGDLKPEKSVSARIEIAAQTGLVEGFYALPSKISYTVNGIERTEDTALIVEVKTSSWLSSMRLPILILILAATGIFIGFKIYKRPKGRRKRR
ncbi:MAG: hypothetical protein MUO26_11510 [Methanotrichaceae archaeon]|nr:hypothetical protein [Methanotrichaceae archaeon]